MAKTDIGPKISVEGESEYRKRLQSSKVEGDIELFT